MANILIVGIRSQIGRHVAYELNKEMTVWGTSRQPCEAKHRISFDPSFVMPDELDRIAPQCALICAAITNMDECQREPILTRSVNVEAVVRIANYFLDRQIFVTFVSSSSVFDGLNPYPPENSVYSPTTEYGKQKMEAEIILRAHPNAREYLSIVRLTKVVSATQGITASFLKAIKNEQEINAFSDLKLSPISLKFSAEILSKILRTRVAGIFHISGQADLFYSDFAEKLAAACNKKKALIKPIYASRANVNVLYKPQFASLGMKFTEARLGIQSEPLELLIEQLVNDEH